MSKHFTIALLVLSVCALTGASASESGNFDEFIDYEEIRLIPNELGAFANFCLISRDWVMEDIEESPRSLTMDAFKILLGAVEADESSGGSSDGQTIIVEDDEDEREEAEFEDEDLDALLDAFKTAFASRSLEVTEFVSRRLESLKRYDPTQVETGLSEACKKASMYTDELERDLEDYKFTVLDDDVEFANVGLRSIGCATAHRLHSIEQGCRIAYSMIV